MATQSEKPRVTEVQVRMDCNGCVQKIKKALHRINGIYELYIDFPQQKITIVGQADLERIAKAIKKTRKSAVICCHHTEEPESSSISKEAESTEEADRERPPNEPEKDHCPLPENETAEEKLKQSPEADNVEQSSSETKVVDEGQVVYHYPPDHSYRGIGHSYRGQWNYQCSDHEYRDVLSLLPSVPGFRHEPPTSIVPSRQLSPIHVTHSYNSYEPSPHVTRYEYASSPPRYTHYGRPDEHYTAEDYYYRYQDNYRDDHHENGNISSVFSEENPNACTIV